MSARAVGAGGANGTRADAAPVRVVPPLHAIAADEVLDRPDFRQQARALLAWGGPGLALHLRAHGRPGAFLFGLAADLVEAAADAGALLVVNDRLDVALAAGVPGVQLGARSLPLAEARRLAPTRRLGYSAHAAEEAAAAAAASADWVLLGTTYPTPSHPGRPAVGPALLRETARALAGTAPIVAIGGLTPERVAEVLAAGAAGVAVLRGIWAAPEPLAAAARFREAIDAVRPRPGGGPAPASRQ